jgi:hypothetical protein
MPRRQHPYDGRQPIRSTPAERHKRKTLRHWLHLVNDRAPGYHEAFNAANIALSSGKIPFFVTGI